MHRKNNKQKEGGKKSLKAAQPASLDKEEEQTRKILALSKKYIDLQHSPFWHASPAFIVPAVHITYNLILSILEEKNIGNQSNNYLAFTQMQNGHMLRLTECRERLTSVPFKHVEFFKDLCIGYHHKSWAQELINLIQMLINCKFLPDWKDDGMKYVLDSDLKFKLSTIRSIQDPFQIRDAICAMYNQLLLYSTSMDYRKKLHHYDPVQLEQYYINIICAALGLLSIYLLKPSVNKILTKYIDSNAKHKTILHIDGCPQNIINILEEKNKLHEIKNENYNFVASVGSLLFLNAMGFLEFEMPVVAGLSLMLMLYFKFNSLKNGYHELMISMEINKKQNQSNLITKKHRDKSEPISFVSKESSLTITPVEIPVQESTAENTQNELSAPERIKYRINKSNPSQSPYTTPYLQQDVNPINNEDNSIETNTPVQQKDSPKKYEITKDIDNKVIGTVSIDPRLFPYLDIEQRKVLKNLCKRGKVLAGDTKGQNGFIYNAENKCYKIKNADKDYRFFAYQKIGAKKNNKFEVCAIKTGHKATKKIIDVRDEDRDQPKIKANVG